MKAATYVRTTLDMLGVRELSDLGSLSLRDIFAIKGVGRKRVQHLLHALADNGLGLRTIAPEALAELAQNHSYYSLLSAALDLEPKRVAPQKEPSRRINLSDREVDLIRRAFDAAILDGGIQKHELDAVRALLARLPEGEPPPVDIAIAVTRKG